MVIITSTHVVRAEAHCQLAIALVSIYACSKFEALYLVRSTDKKLSYRRGIARCVVSVEILATATQQCRYYLYDKS